MSGPVVVFDAVWKKFRRGEIHDSLRDLIPAMIGSWLRPKPIGELATQEFWVLKDVSFEVRPGEALGIIGPNGAGKSTALKVLTRILRPTQGRSEVTGRVGALIEVAAGFHPDLTGRENVYLQGSIMGMKQAEIAARFDQIVDFSGVSAFIDTPIKRYSSGMNARLGFAIAAHLNPDVLFIDEVLAVGDASFQSKCFERLQEVKRNGVALVFVSHNLPAVEALCQNALLLVEGAPVFLGAPREAIARHLTPQFKSGRTTNDGFSRSGDQAVQVDKVRIMSESGQEVGSFPSGAAATFELSLTCLDGPRDVLVGFMIQAIDRTTVFGENSSVSLPPTRMKAGDAFIFSIKIRSLALHGGRYYVSVAVHNPVTGAVHDSHEAAYVFEVDPPQESNRTGILGLRTDWTLKDEGQRTVLSLTPGN